MGAFLSFFLIYSIVMEKLSQLIGNIAEQSMLLQQAYPLHKLMLLKPEVEEPENPIPLRDPKGRISFHGLSFHYLNRPLVIRDFTLDILPGERVAIVGGSGNGKSTLLKLICRFYDPQAGSIELDGISVQHLSFQDLRGQVGYVSQESHLFGLSIRDNIKFGSPEATDEEMEQAAKDAFAHEFILNLPLGYDTLIGDRGMKLSGGQKQRIAIARLLIRNPRIVLLDEATSALDNVSESEVKTALDRLFQGRTMIAVAHRLTTIQDFDRIVVMNEGKVAEVGTPNRLDETIGERGVQLSGGQRQRLALARAMLRDPELLILDEATSALDMETERRVQRTLDDNRKGRTTIIIAHRLSTVMNADLIYVMKEGRIAEKGTHEELMINGVLYPELVRVYEREETGEASA